MLREQRFKDICKIVKNEPAKMQYEEDALVPRTEAGELPDLDSRVRRELQILVICN